MIFTFLVRTDSPEPIERNTGEIEGKRKAGNPVLHRKRTGKHSSRPNCPIRSPPQAKGPSFTKSFDATWCNICSLFQIQKLYLIETATRLTLAWSCKQVALSSLEATAVVVLALPNPFHRAHS